MASGAASFMPASISSAMTRPHASTDSRLLQNLIKSEKTYQNHLASVVQSSGTAAAALKAWGTSEARDVAQTSSQLADLLHDVADAQNNYLEAIKGYREALKDVADREASIRTIVKDRDILVSRLIKASKKNGDVPHAQRELTACEEVLEEEERALIGVKRRTFKEALSMRMKLMGDAGNRMIECAKEAILLLDEFDQHAGDERMSTGQREAVDSYGQSYYATDYPGQGDHTQMDQQQQWGQEGVADDLYYQDQQYQGEQYQGEQYHQGEQDMSRYHSHEVASVTPSQSASQTARGMGTTYGSTANNNGYTRPQFAGGAPPEVEERADSDASSVADPREESNQQAHYNRGGGYADRASAAHGQDAMPVPEQPVEAQHTDFYGGDNSNQQPQPQMYSATAPSFNYDGPQMAPVPQAPRMYQRGAEASTDDGQVRGNAGWGSSRPSARNNDDGNSSDEGGGGRQTGGRGGPSRPKAQKRNSFFGKFKGLFKADLGDNEAKSPTKSRHSRNESYDRNSSVGGWNTRTDTNISSTRKSASKANGTYQAPHQNLMKPLNQGGDDSGSDDDDNRPDLVRVVNPNIAGKKASSDVGKTLRRTPSEISRITAGPKSVKQQREEEARKQADAERQAREAVMGAGIGSRPTVQRADTITSTASKPKKKKKATRSIAGSEIGTSATRQAPSASARPSSTVGSAVGTAGRPGPGSYVVSGDLSSGSRGLATLVLPSDIGKPDRPYPSIMPPTGLSRSNSTATAATGRASSIGGGTTATKKKKKRQSAVSDGMGTGLTAMSPTDSGKWTTNNWVQSPHGGSSNGIAGQAVAGAGLVPYTPASPEEIAQKYANNALTGSQIQRPGSAQSGAPLRSAMKGHNEHLAAASSSKQQQTATPASIAPKPLEAPPAVEVPPVQTQIEEANNNLGPSISAPPPVSAVIAESTQQAPAEESQEPPSASGDVQDEYEEEAPVRRSSPKLGEDKTFDGTGRLDLGRQGSPLPDSPEQPRAPLPAAQKPTVPHLDMPTSEPFKFDVPGMQQRPSQSGDEGDILTPGERSAYERLLGSDGMRTPSGAAPALSGLGMQSFGRPGGPKRPAPVPGSAPAAPVAVAPEPQRPAQQQPVSSSAQDEEPSTASTAYFPEDSLRPSLNPMAGRLSTDEPSRTYSNTSTVRGATTPVPQASRAAPAESASTKPAASTHLLPPSNNATSDVSATPSRRKSVRMAPDTKLPPDTPVMERDPGLVSDGFGGFTSAPAAQSAPPAPVMHTVTAPGSALAPSGNAPLAPTTAAELPPLSSKIAPPPSAPPRLPTKDNHASPPERERERSSGWTTRVDRRLGGNDDSSDEEGGRGAGGAGEDAYASARRAMGAASKRWKDTVSPSKKKSSGGEGGKSGSTKKSKVNSSGYNAAIPLPKGMEVVGRQKASK